MNPFALLQAHPTMETKPMKKVLLGAAVCIASTAPAFAADLPAPTYPTKAPANTARETVYNWTGFYVGGHIGGVLGGPDSLETHNARLLGGVQIGVDRQFAANWVIGSEVQISGIAGNSGRGVLFPANTLVASSNNTLLGSVTGRIGYTWGPFLLYAKGGYAARNSTDVNASAGGIPVAVTTSGRHQDGITAGGGLEYMFAPHWSAKAEYQYYTFGDTHFTAPAPLIGSKFWNDEHVLKLGINYRLSQGS
jgi:outer membrane immunogenic protein